MTETRRGLLIILSSPSGAGKTTMARRLMAWDATIAFSVSATTRPPRPGEVDGREYHFLRQDAFDALAAAGGMLEHARVFGHCYGSPRRRGCGGLPPPPPAAGSNGPSGRAAT